MLKNYQIENQLLFQADDNRLVRLSDGEFVELSLTASRLLLMMMANHGQVVTRERIFTEIFDRYGAQSTGNNLNQYISNLRKQFIYLGWEGEIIRTVPRVGFTVPENVNVEIQQRRLNTYGERAEHDEVDEQTPVSSAQPRRLRYLKYFWLTMMLFIIGGCYVTHLTVRHSYFNWFSLTKVKPHKIVREDGCEYFHITSGTLMSALLTENQPLSALPGIDSLCSNKPTSIHYVMQSGGGPGKTRTFILSCSGDVGRESACVSQYESREN